MEPTFQKPNHLSANVQEILGVCRTVVSLSTMIYGASHGTARGRTGRQIVYLLLEVWVMDVARSILEQIDERCQGCDHR